ncbi:transposase zinc-binding domain-containing protein [Paraburkholderia sp. GAS448]|uniref:transposase zinc-binding domain-containing protein n=1 Tax=Paraburkholderia sp. GAS448 TaxID=3035136 RepID=UPI003D192C69
MRPALEVADVFRQCGPSFRLSHAEGLSRVQRRVMSAIELCRTAALGAHLEQCDACGHQRISYDSCLMGSVFLWGEEASERARTGDSRRFNSPLKASL